MRSRVEIVADRGPDGAPVLPVLRADGILAVRRTAPSTVHLVGAAAGPLGGDVVEVSVHVRPGAVLALRSVAATIALPGPAGGRADLVVEVTVERGGLLDLGLEPLVVCRGADLTSRTVIAMDDGASVVAREQVVLGRAGEEGGTWRGRTVADAAGRPVLRSTVSSQVLAPAAGGVRAVVTTLLLGGAAGPYAGGPVHPVAGDAVACRLEAGGVLVTAVGPDLSAALRDHDHCLHTACVTPSTA